MHWWFAETDRVAAYLRVLIDPEGVTHIGRVCTAREARGKGLAGQLLQRAIAGIDEPAPRPIEIHAQAYLRSWYESFGFVVTGDELDGAGIPHLPMCRPVATNTQPLYAE